MNNGRNWIGYLRLWSLDGKARTNFTRSAFSASNVAACLDCILLADLLFVDEIQLKQLKSGHRAHERDRVARFLKYKWLVFEILAINTMTGMKDKGCRNVIRRCDVFDVCDVKYRTHS